MKDEKPAPESPAARPRRMSLEQKLSRSTALVLAIIGASTLLVVAVVDLVVAEQVNDALQVRIKDGLHARGESLVDGHAIVLRSLVQDNAVTEMQRTLGEAVRAEDVVYGVFFDREGRAWAYCSPKHPCASSLDDEVAPKPIDSNAALSDLALSRDAARSGRTRRRVLEVFNTPVVEFSRPIEVAGQTAGTLRYGVSTRSLQHAVDRARASQRELFATSLLIIAILVSIALLTTMAIARRTARRITQPLAALTSASESLAQGEPSPKVDIKSGDELEVLGDAFNRMVSDLKTSYSRLEASNVELKREIEERKVAQAERGELKDHLLQAQKMDAFGQLAGGVAHDFNNILAVALGNSELIKLSIREGKFGDNKSIQEIAEANEQVREAGLRGANLTRQLLAFARRESETQSTLNVNDAIKAFRKMMRRLLEENVELKVTTDLPLPHVRISAGHLEQVLMNLCVNARDAMPKGGTIRLATNERVLEADSPFTSGVAPAGRYVVFETSDTGQGMPEEVVSRAFDPFFTTKPPGQGTGLGLATVDRIVRDAGGYIDVASRVNEGTTFRIYLPAEEDEDLELEASSDNELPLGFGRRVLLCEDDRSVRSMTTRILERVGYQVVSVDNGVEALKALTNDEFELLITDAVMPEMDGGRLAQEAFEKRPSLRVLFVSGYTGGVLEKCGVREDSPNFLRKPFSSLELLERMEAVMAQQEPREPTAPPRSGSHDNRKAPN